MTSDIVERLRVQSDSEEVMKAWDHIRTYLLNGGRGSLARDIFESILSNIDEEREEAASHIESQALRIAELGKELGGSRAAALEEAAKLASEFHWQLPMYADPAVNEATDDAACAVQEQIAAAIRALIPEKKEG